MDAAPARSPAQHAAGPAALAQASSALWLATLSLMTAFMHVQAPAHRLLLARRVSRNLSTLAEQPCFDAGVRQRFATLSRRWSERACEYDPDHSPAPRALGRLRALWSSDAGA